MESAITIINDISEEQTLIGQICSSKQQIVE